MADITEQIIREAPQIEAYKLGLLESAKTLSETPLQLPAYQIAPMSRLQQEAIALGESGIGAYAPFMQAGQRAMEEGIATTMQGIGPATTGQLQGYMNPYQQLVTQQALGEMRRQADMARQQQAAQAVQAGAFGGTREGVQRAEMERGIQDIMSQRIAQDYAQNYAQAQNLASQEQTRALQAGQLFGQLGVQQAALGQTAQQLNLQDTQTLATLGQLQQQQAQAELEAGRSTALQAAMTPYQQTAFLSDIYKGAPSTQMSITGATAPTTSPFLQAAGLGIAGLSAATGAQKAGLFG
jgi:hypothetical protein